MIRNVEAVKVIKGEEEAIVVKASEAMKVLKDLRVDSFKKVDDLLVVNASTKELIIDKASVVDNLIDFIQKKDVGMSHIQIVLGSNKEYDENGNVVKETLNNYVGFIKLPENLASRHQVFKFEEMVLRDGKNNVRVTLDSKNPATKEILSVKYGEDEEQGEFVLKYGLYKYETKSGYRFFKKQGSMIVDLEDETKRYKFKSVFADPNNEASGLASGWSKYIPFGASPSNDRQKVIYMIDITTGIKRAHEILSRLTYGAYDLNTIDAEVTYDELAKASTRWFQWMAPSTSLGRVNCYAIYHGKFNGDRVDGLSWGAAEGFCRMVFEKYGIVLDLTAVQGLFNQSRMTLSKVGTMPINKELLKLMILFWDANPVRFNWNEVTPEVVQDIKDGKYNGRITIFGEGEVEGLYDLNGMKSNYDFSTERPEYNLLRILRNNSSNFSKSIFEKMLAKDKEKAIEIAKGLMTESTFTKINNVFMEPKAKVLSPEVFEKESWFMDEIISNMFPEYLKSDRNLSLNAMDNITKAINKICDKFKVPMEGRNAGITAGVEAMFMIDGFLGDNEVYCSAAERMLKAAGVPEELWELFMIKYPSMDINEYSTPKVVSKKEMKKRINAAQAKAELAYLEEKKTNPKARLVFSKKLANLFIEYYMTLHDSVMVVPACELFKNLHAGSDFDTDQVAWSILKVLIDVLKQEEKIAVVIK